MVFVTDEDLCGQNVLPFSFYRFVKAHKLSSSFYMLSAVFRKCFKGGGGAKWKFQEIRGGGGDESGIQLFSMIYAILIDIRLDELPRGDKKKARGGGGKCLPP